MNHLNAYEDLEESLNTLSIWIDEYNESQRVQQELVNTVGKLNNETEMLKNSNFCLTQQLQAISGASGNQESVCTLYIQIKEKYTALDDKHNELLKENMLMQEKYMLEKTALQERFTLEKNTVHEELTMQIHSLEMDSEQQKNEFLRKEDELYNELQLAQASKDLQCDEMESRLQALQLQLKESNQTCNCLRKENSSLKIRSNYDMESANKRISDLQELLQHTEQQLRAAQEQLFHFANKNRNVSVNSDGFCQQTRSGNACSSKVQHIPNPKRKTVPYENRNLQAASSSNFARPPKYDSLEINTVNAPKSANQNSCNSEEFQDELFANLNIPEEPSARVSLKPTISRNMHMPSPKSKTVPYENLQSNYAGQSKYDSFQINAASAPKNTKQNSCESEEFCQDELFANLSIPEAPPTRVSLKPTVSKSNKSFLPALKQISKTVLKPGQSRKRKLYNPGNFDYLTEKD